MTTATEARTAAADLRNVAMAQGIHLDQQEIILTGASLIDEAANGVTFVDPAPAPPLPEATDEEEKPKAKPAAKAAVAKPAAKVVTSPSLKASKR